MSKLESFTYKDQTLATRFIESAEVFPGVRCDVYDHPETQQRDLGIIHIEAGKKTQPQRVLNGEQTIEGYISGKGRLTIVKPTGEKLEFPVGPDTKNFSYAVDVGDIMQWQAVDQLVVFEICYPPYAEGRFENLANDAIE